MLNIKVEAVNDACFNRDWKQSLVLHQVQCHLDDRVLFEPVNMSLHAGQGLCISGPNGVGKTSLLNAIVGLRSHTGSIEWQRDSRGFDKPAYLGHEQGFHPHLTVAENLRYTQVAPLKPTHVTAMLEEVGLSNQAHSLYGALSRGQQRRLGMAYLRLHPSPLWVLDEPLTHLDALSMANFQCLMIQHLQEGGILVVASHQNISLLDKQLSLSVVHAC